MPEPPSTLEQFRRAGYSHLKAAELILDSLETGSAGTPAQVPASAAYLVHVALECGIKARLLFRGGFTSTDALAAKLPHVHKTLFSSRKGHDLTALSQQVRLQEFVATNGRSWRNDSCWNRITSPQRPYSLRYASEQVDRNAAREEVQRASELLGVLLSGIGGAAPRRARRQRVRP